MAPIHSSSEMIPAAIVLATANARYAHIAFGLRWLWANLGSYQQEAQCCEYTLRHSALEIAEDILRRKPRMVGLGVYIWNVRLMADVAALLRRIQPDLWIVVGGPEVSWEAEAFPAYAAVDYVITGEGEAALPRLIERLWAGDAPSEKVLAASPPDLASLKLPYAAYAEEDLAHRVMYVEASRGCPFQCAFCLSARDRKVREFPLDTFFSAMEDLLARGVQHFKFVDRTFNLQASRMAAILNFFREQWKPGGVLHLEIMPERLDEAMFSLLADFPAGGLHLEVGVQSFSPAVLAAIGRRQDPEQTEQWLRRLRRETGAAIHADLIAGLPRETLSEYAAGFNRIMELDLPEIQLGILKRLRGAPLADPEYAESLIFSPAPPYEVVRTAWMSFEELQELKRFSRYFDLFYNSGHFPAALPALWTAYDTPFDAFLALSRQIWRRMGKTHELSLTTLAGQLYEALCAAGVPETAARDLIKQDVHRIPGRKDKADFLV